MALSESIVLTLIKQFAIAGLSLAVVRNGELTEHYTLGVREGNLPVVDNTIFEAASLSKPVFAYAVMKLVERGVLDLDTPLSQYFDYQDIAHDKRALSITARMVLSHQTGLVNQREEKPLHFVVSPGEKFHYSGEGFFFLQKVVEKLEKTTLEEFARREVFIPLGMKNSSFIWQENFQCALGYDEQGKPMEKQKPLQGNSSYTLHTTALDFARFLVALLNGEGLKKETLELMLRPESKIADNLGWCLGSGSADRKWRNFLFSVGR